MADFQSLFDNPVFQMGLGLYGGAGPRNAGVLQAFNLMQNAQSNKVKQALEAEQMKRLNEQTQLFGEQVRQQARRNQLAEDMQKQFSGMLPGVLGMIGLGNPGQQTAPQAPQAPQISGVPSTAAPQSLQFGFPKADQFVSKVEGGLEQGPFNRPTANFGIDQAAHPEIDVTKLTPEVAQGIRKTYWDAIGGDQLPPKTAMVAYDAAINQGPAFAKQILQQSGGDPTLMMALRRKQYADLAAQPKYAQYAKGWENRMGQLDQQLASIPQQGITAPQAAQQVTGNQQGGMQPYRALQMLGGLMAGQGGDPAKAMEMFSGALKPNNLQPGTFIQDANGNMTQVPDVLGNRKVAVQEHSENRQTQEQAQKQAKQIATDKAAYENVTTSANDIKQKAQSLLQDPGLSGLSGLWGAAGQIPGSQAYDTKQRLESMKSEIVNTLLQSIRSASQNGASGYGQFTEPELELVKGLIAPLRPGMSNQAMRDAIGQVVKYMDTLQSHATSFYENAHGTHPISGLPVGARPVGTSSGKQVYKLPNGQMVVEK